MSYPQSDTGSVSLSPHYYFITTVTADRTPVFTDLYLVRQVVNCMREYHDNAWLHSAAWVFMPNHLHWLFQLEESQSLQDVIGKFKGKSARLANRHLKRHGSFWQAAFYEHVLEEREEMRKFADFMLANPLRAGLAQRLEDYAHWDACWL